MFFVIAIIALVLRDRNQDLGSSRSRSGPGFSEPRLGFRSTRTWVIGTQIWVLPDLVRAEPMSLLVWTDLVRRILVWIQEDEEEK